MPTRRPSGSSAAATWVSRWVSTPPVIPGATSTMVMAIPFFLNSWGDGTAVPDRSDGRFGLLVATRTNHPPQRRDVPCSLCGWKSSVDDARRRLMLQVRPNLPVLPKLFGTSSEAVDPTEQCH